MNIRSDFIRLGSRESPLALAQTEMVKHALLAHWPHLKLEVRTFKTQGDIILDTALSKAGDKGLFVKELELALLQDEIDLAVHSMKDMPGELPEGLMLVSVLEREDPRDVLLSREGLSFAELPAGAIVGTSSLRREAQLRRLRSGLRYEVIRGNLQTRFRKLQEGPYQAIVLAAAGVHRLGWEERITQAFDPWNETVPAVAQGILGVEFRRDDNRVAACLRPLQIHAVEIARKAERALLDTLAGGCQLPMGAYCREVFTGFEMRAVVLSPDGQQMVTADITVDPNDPAGSGTALATELLDMGADDILAAIRQPQKLPVDSP
ncbi:MAG TPA: hydroxymethylbilane synthase [Coleofasciculaceae cyanobacterium]|jgi:hydroxymethylbilane synthase